MLKRIHIHNYRSFVNFEWHPPSSCVLVGPNGAKSSLLEVLWTLQDVLVVGKLHEETGFPSTCAEWLREPEQTIEVDLDSKDDGFLYRISYRKEGTSGRIREELRLANGGLLYRSADGKVELFGDAPAPAAKATIAFDRRRSFVSVLEPRPDNQKITAFREAVRSIRGVKPDPRRLGGAATGEAPTLERDLSNFADWYRGRVQEDPDAMTAMMSDLRDRIAGFQQLRLEPISPEVKDLRARFFFDGTSYELSWAKLSDGQRLLIALYGLLRFELAHAGLAVLDEIENYVAPAEIQPWLRVLLDSASAGGRQVLVLSHHPETINYLAADEAWRMWRDPASGVTRIGKLQPDLEAGVTAYDLLKLGAEDG
ncbi:MAG: AAA family ATPase [Deltaproteobacteria bacterium]|nr:AAA family ATPase [Deltaproteobacteria bacterium]